MTYIQYIISYLLHHNPLLKEQVGYGACCNDYSQYRVFIKASNFFEATTYGTLATLPSLPLESIEGVPLLFGSPTMKWQGDTLIVDADIIASSYFLMSRYEEMLFPDEKRDIHGRFIGKASIAYRGEFLHRPIVEEYGVLLRQWLRKAGVDVPDVPNSYSAITLTHDVDTLSHYRRIRGSLGGMWRALRGGRDKVDRKSVV